MPNKITYTIKTADGKEHQVSKENIDKHGIQSYADAYEGATIRMRDSKKGDYDIPLSNYNDAKAQGLHAFSWEHKPVVAQNNPQATQKQPAPKVNTTPGTPMTAAQKAQVLNNISGIVDQSQSDLSRTMRKIDYAKQNTGLDVKPIKLGENRNVATKKNKNGQTTYLDAEGNRFDDHAQANFSQTQIEEDEAKRKDLLGYIDKKAMSSVNSAYDKQYSELEDFKKKHPYLSAFSRALSAFSGRMSGGGTANINQYRPEEARTGLAALAFNQKTRQAIDEGKRYEQGDTGFRGRSTRGLKKGLTSASTYDFGISDTDIAGSLKEAADRYAKGQATQMDELLLDAAALNSETEAKYADALGGWFGAGEAIPGVASFMMQTGSNPMSGFGKATAQSVAKTVIKRAVQKFGTGLAAKAAITLAKGATRVAADAVEAGVVTAMYSPTKIVGDYLNRKTGTVVHDGNGGYTFEGKEYSDIKAVAKAINDQNAENLSEMWGDYLPGIGKVGKLIGKGVRKIGLGKVVNAFEQMSSSQWMKTWNEFMDRTKWNGLSGEYMEEAEKNLYNALTNGDMTLDTNPNTGVFSRKINEDTFKSVALMSGIMSGISTVGYTRFKYKASRGQKKADNNAKAVLGVEKWSEIKKLIDNADDKSIGGIIEQIGNDNSLNTKQKMAILDYQYKSAVAHGANIQDLKNKLEGNYDEKANRYDAGYHATENELANIKNELELRHRQLTQTFKDDPTALQQIEEDPKAFLQGLKESEVGGKKAKVINAYEETRAAYDGMIQRVKDNIDDAITENNTVIEQRTHQDGNIYPATMKLGDRKVYVVGGNVQMNEDGKGIDHEKSSSSVMIRDAETGKIEMVDPSAILSVDTPVNAEEEKATSSEQIKQTYAQEQANKIDGVLEFKVGDTYSILDEDQKQHTIQIIGEAIDEKTKQPNPDMVMASIDGLEPTMLPKKQIQAMNDEENLWRLEQSLKQGEDVENTTPHSAQSYGYQKKITLINEDGKPVRGEIVSGQNEDGRFEVQTEEPVRGKTVNHLTAEELDAMHAQIQEEQGEQMESPALVAENATTQKENVAGLNDGTITENTTVQKEETPQHQSTALERIPTNEQGEPIYEQVDPETAWDAIVEQTEGDESIAQSVADGMVADMEAAVKRAEKAKVKGGTTIAEKIAAEKERVANIEQAKATLEHWKKIASTNSRRQEAIQAEERRKSKEAALLRKEQEEKERAMREEEERVKRDLAQPQALDYKLSDEVDENGYPFVLTSAGEVAFGKIGKETGLTPAPILLSEGVITNSKTNAGYGLVHIEARHGEQIRNAGYPSVVAFVEEVAKHYDVIREGINRSGEQTYMLQLTDRHNNTLMVELSGDGTYYNINTAGIFKTSYGKNRREVYNRHATDNQSTESGEESQGEAQSGTTSPSRMKSSTRSSAGKVSETSNAVQGNAEKSSENEESIENQENKSEEEIVIKEKIRKAINAYEEAQEKFDNLFSLLVKEKESDPFDNREWREVNRTKEELKDVLLQLNTKELGELLKQVSGKNTEYVIKKVLDIVNKEEHRLIAFNAILDKQSNITPEYKEGEKAIPVSEFVETDEKRAGTHTMLTGVFHDKGYVVGSDTHLLLARKEDYDKSLEGKVTNKKGEVINGKYPNWRAVVNRRKQGKSWGVNLEELHAFTRGVLTKPKTEKANPSTKKDAKIAFKTANGKIVLCYANALDKALQGAKSIGAKSFFSNDDVFAITQTPKGYVICPMLNLEQNIDDNTFAYVPRVSELQHSTETTHSSNVVHSFGNSASQNNASIKLSDTSFASEEEASIFITQMELDADIAQEIPLTIENWDKEFGEDGIVSTPIGDVKMGENQFAKLMRAGRNGKLGMLKPTLEYPDAIVEENSKAKEGTNTERPSSFIFIKSFRKPDGTRYYYFTSITVSVEGKEVVVSNQEKSRNRILRLLMGNSVIWRTPKDATTSSAEKQGLDYVHPDKAEGETKGSVITPQNTSSAGKVSESSNVVQENTEKTSENEDLFAKAERIASQEQAKRTRKNKATRVETNPTEAQKEAGNYKKGHIKVDGMNITIEQPKGSIRRGKDASGKEWESEMHNTYGYIRGTEGVDGDHIDIFLSDNPNEGNVFVVDQVNKDGSFDEHKVMYGFADKESARQAYLSNYEDGWQGLGNITEVSKEEFKKWIDSSKRKTKPFAEYKGIIKSNKGVSSAVAMSEDEYLASKGLNGNMTDYMLDKLRIPHSETARQQKQREKEAARVRADFDNQKEEARKEYRQKIAKGELRQPTKQEAKEREIAKLIKTANGHEDNPSVQAARRSLAKRGVDWRTDKGDTSDNDLADKKELEDFERVEKKIMPGLNNDLTRLRLRALKEGELSHVERRYIENKGFSFVGNERIESIEDVAYIFKQLETSSVENSFMALIKDGKPTILHLSIGGYAMTPAPIEQAIVAVEAIKPDKVVFIHNHPSGNIKASKADLEVQRKMKATFGDKAMPAIIINTTSGKFGTFSENGNLEDGKMPQSKEQGNIPVKVYNFSQQVFAKDWNPDTAFKVFSSESIAAYVSSHRLGEHKKMSLLILNHAGHVTGNVFLPWTTLKDAEKHENVLQIASYVNQMGGTAAVIYGNYKIGKDIIDTNESIRSINKQLSDSGLYLMDVINITDSAHDRGVMEEKISYGSSKVSQESNIQNTTRDAEYIKAVENNDTETIQRLLSEEAERKGYSNDSSYQGSLAFNGAAPSQNAYFETKEERKEAWENDEYEDTMSLGDYVDSGIDTNNLEWNLTDPMALRQADPERREAIENLRQTVRSNSKTITIYRAVDANIKENEIRNGDWVTPSRSYAEYHIGLQDWENGRVIEQEVSIDDLWWDGNDIAEWGYDNGKGEVYKNTPNNRKMFEVTYDDKGNIIPLSERFNEDNDDIRYRYEDEVDNEAKTFAEEHNLNVADVIAYKKAMDEGLLRDANKALSEIRRKLREENKGLSLSGFVKKFSPIREALYKQFGDLGVLEKEYHDSILKERGLMEAARKREEEERKRQNKPIEELMSMTSEERDAEYMRALEAKDEKRMSEVLQAEAKLKGYSMGAEYQGEGDWKAPSNPGYSSTEERRAALEKDAPHLNIDDIANGYINHPGDIFTDLHAYGNDNESGRESAKAISDAISDIEDGKEMPKVTVYRAVPTSVEEESLRNGDWVTPSKAYAKEHGEHRLDGDYRIIEQKVPANELWWDGNDIREWGFDNGKDYAYKNTENSRKLNDLITRDDQGNVILPSQRFNDQVEDERFRNDEELEKVNQRFNEELENLTEENADKITLWLGNPSDVLLSSGIENKPLKLYGNKVIKKMKKHGFALDELRDLPKAVADPIAVFDNLGRLGNRSILTELTTEQGNFLVTIDMGKGEKDVDFNIVSSVFGKGESKIVSWIERGLTAYINKKKALNYLHHSAPIAEALSNSRLSSVANIVKSFENPTNSSEKVLDRKTTQAKEVAEKERQQMVERASELAKTLHLDNVEIVTSASTLEGKKAKAKGFYSTSTGKITIIIPNHSNIADVEKTLLHEAVAHHGLRKLFGEHFDNFLDNVFKNASEDVRREIVKLAAKNKWDFRIATEEYLASLAEDTNFEKMPNGLWDKVKRLFSDMLRSIGLLKQKDGELNDNELRYILWRSYKNLKEKGQSNSILNKAEDIAMQHRLKVGNYSESTDKEVRFRDGEPQSKERVSAAERYEQRVSRSIFQSQEALQDSMLGLKEAMDAIMRAEGKEMYIEDIEGFENAYLGENRLSSVNQAETEAFAHLVFKPMLDEVAKLAKNDKERSELTDYMMAKHGLERNEVMRKNALEEIINNEKLSDAQKDARTSIAEHRDYAGLTALTDTNSVEEAESEARRMVEEYEQKHDTTNLWEKVNIVTKGILSKSYECGMMNKQTFEKVRDMYKFYIPLRGFDEETSRDAYAYLSHGQSAFNAPIRTAKGRSSKADDPFANMQSMAESAIMQGNRNVLVKQKFLNFALNHPSDLVSVSTLWLKYDDVSEEWRPVFPDNIEETDTADEVEKKIQDFEQRMTDLAKQDPERYKHGKDTENIPYRIVESRDLRQHQVIVKRNGRDYVLTINGNPRAAQALNGLTNPDNDISGAIGAILNFGEKINRQLSAFYTTRNPDFVISNFIRDMLYANSIVWVKERPNYALRFHRNIGRCNPAQMKILLSKHKKGELDMNNSLEHMFHQFIMNGGETGYANVRDIEQHKNDIQRELKRANGKIGIKRSLSLLGEKLDEYNRAVENCARFAAFLTSREMGRTIDRSIYDAKDISVNFNKKGSGAKFMNAKGQTKAGKTAAFVSGFGRSFYLFWNAAIQGTTNFGRQFKRHPAKAFTASATMFILGALVAGMGMGEGDDDDKNSYWNLPESVRRSNILFRVGDQWISIPLPVEYRSIYGMGELMISTMSGKEHLTNSELGKAIAGQATQILPIDFLEGEGGVKAFVPSAVKPFADVISNKGWTGMPIYKDTPYNKNMPEWTKTYKSANKYLIGLAKTLNEVTGGDTYTKGAVDINPAQIEYLLNGYFGGVSNTIDKLTKSAETIAGKRDYDPKSFLLLNRVLKSGDERTEERAINREYYRLKEEYEILRDRLKNYENDTDNGVFDFSEKINFLYNSPEYARYEIFEDYREDIEGLYKELNEAMSDDERAYIETELTGLKKQMIEEMNTTRK